MSRGPRTPAPGPLLEGRETRCRDGFPVTRLVLFEQAAAHQKRDAATPNLDRRNHDHAPGAALAEASSTDSRCWFMGHVTGCYCAINRGYSLTFRM